MKNIVSLLVILNVATAYKGPKRCEATLARDVKHFDVRLSKTSVPNQRTTYVCQAQPIPVSEDREYHAVAFEPLIENKHLIHHMLLFGCGESYDTPTKQAQSYIPHVCGPPDYGCRFFLVQWSMGMDGQICSPPDAGVRFGFKSFKTLALQIHWNNANLTDGMADSSGFRIYYTRELRKYDVGNLQVGQNDLEIPPGQDHYAQTGSCSSECTSQWLSQPTFLTRAHIHMHYTGDGGVLELVRGDKVIQEVVRDLTYNYARPPVHDLQEPVKVLPGDELRLTCFFNTKDGDKRRNRTVYFGEGSDGEMCYAFITYYPNVDHFNQCVQFDNYDVCTENGLASFGECIFDGFLHTFQSGMADAILEHCNTKGNKNEEDNIHKLCSEQCKDAIQEVTEHPCMQDRLGKQARRVLLPQIAAWAEDALVKSTGGTVKRESAVRSAKTLLSWVRAPPLVPWPDRKPERLRSSCCALAI
ncbi:DBH-like monooxygenase protein 1 homolog [Plakobranchus ocellatus]|uniref:DBH-like monooxygenase protein 1 homolog n=1 Tax=Plakobranchus ocellatus TaxID=259542 RepID=A0AAV4DED9_9GAST|nr:DBH-like monooxygenase protein 1 homolog [Plakobranchus ocellatus]